MITREKLDEILSDKSPFQEKNIDHGLKALMLLRERVPYDVCNNIISGAEHDQVYLCDIDEVLPYLTEEDVLILADCNMSIDSENERLFLFV